MAEDQGNKNLKEKRIMSPFWILAIIALIAIITLSGIIAYQQSKKSDFDELQPQQYQCERWIEEADFLSNKFVLNNNQWKEEDKTHYERLNLLINRHCMIELQEQQIELQKLKDCSNFYITIQGLIDKMENRTLETLGKSDQQLYIDNYHKYFDNYCNLIQPLIIEEKIFLEFNKTRGNNTDS